MVATMSGGQKTAGSERLSATGYDFNKKITEKYTSGAEALATGKSIISGRNAGETASAAQALANQTGGNTMGFTYE